VDVENHVKLKSIGSVMVVLLLLEIIAMISAEMGIMCNQAVDIAMMLTQEITMDAIMIALLKTDGTVGEDLQQRRTSVTKFAEMD